MRVFGADMVWKRLCPKGSDVARRSVERLMRKQGVQGSCAARQVRTAKANKAAP